MPLTLNALELPEDLVWSDEWTTTLISQQVEPTVSGALLIEESKQLAGRFITLEGTDDAAWATRSQLESLRAMAEEPNEIHELVLPDGREFDVMFRRPAFEAKAVVPFNVSAAGDFYTLKLFLIEV